MLTIPGIGAVAIKFDMQGQAENLEKSRQHCLKKLNKLLCKKVNYLLLLAL